ncbi:MAG: radical SAM protein [Sedimentisphaerales bacterium]|nr:radical SAM protein [Sedimentisphaerales bacterium]
MVEQGCDILLLFPPIREWDNPRNFPTGLGLIAARLRQAGYRVGVIDVNGLRLSDDEVMERIAEQGPSVIGIGGLVTTYGWVKRMAERIRRERADCPIVLGGSVGTSIIETVLRKTKVNVIAVGEADDTVGELMEALLNGRELDDVAGLAFLREGQVVRTAERAMLGDLDELEYPAWDMFPMEVYLANPVVGVGRDIDVISSRGCPFQCQYCYRIFGKKYRGRSAEHVVGEIEVLKRNYDVDFISFQDDCFVVDKQRVHEICDLIDKSSILRGLRWSCTGRVTVCDDELLGRMRASGCVSVSFGIESGSERILRAMKKNASLAEAERVILSVRATGMRCPVSFMIGYPGETRETVLETVAFCEKLNIGLSALMFTCPYPGTPLYEQVRDTERFREQFVDEEDFVLKIGDAVDLVANLTEMTDEQLKSLRDEALAMARENYVPPTEAEAQAQERELYGEVLYEKGQRQMVEPAMQAHRQRHGFNESARGDIQDEKDTYR